MGSVLTSDPVRKSCRHWTGQCTLPGALRPAPSGLSPSPASAPVGAHARLSLPMVCSGVGPELSPPVFPQKLFGFLLEHVGDLAAENPPDLGVVDTLAV